MGILMINTNKYLSYLKRSHKKLDRHSEPDKILPRICIALSCLIGLGIVVYVFLNIVGAFPL